MLTEESERRERERGRILGNHNKSRNCRSKSGLGKRERWNCGKGGHLKKYHKAPKKKGDGKHETTQEANVAGDVLQYALILSLDNTSENWVVDSGASCHATPHRK